MKNLQLQWPIIANITNQVIQDPVFHLGFHWLPSLKLSVTIPETLSLHQDLFSSISFMLQAGGEEKHMCQGPNSHYFHTIGDKLINPIVGVYIPMHVSFPNSSFYING